MEIGVKVNTCLSRDGQYVRMVLLYAISKDHLENPYDFHVSLRLWNEKKLNWNNFAKTYFFEGFDRRAYWKIANTRQKIAVSQQVIIYCSALWDRDQLGNDLTNSNSIASTHPLCHWALSLFFIRLKTHSMPNHSFACKCILYINNWHCAGLRIFPSVQPGSSISLKDNIVIIFDWVPRCQHRRRTGRLTDRTSYLARTKTTSANPAISHWLSTETTLALVMCT